jgi:ATP-dependent Clp protease protease subunit
MIHQPWGQVGRSPAVDVGIQAREFLRTKRLMEELLARHTGQPVETIHRDTDRDHYMDPEEARAYGIIDAIVRRPPGIAVSPPSPNGHPG